MQQPKSRPDWAGAPAPPMPGRTKSLNIDVEAFQRTRDALTSSWLNLAATIDTAIRAYHAHTHAVLSGDSSLDISMLSQPLALLQQQQPPQMLAQMALQNGGGAALPPVAPVLSSAQPDAPVVEESGDGKKKRKKRAYKQRDPNAPKRPLTAYFRYLGEMRPLIQKEINDHPDRFESSGKPGDIAKIATDRWNELSAEKQQPYKAAYQAELKDYETAMKTYRAARGEADPEDPTAAAAAGAEKATAAADDESSSEEEEEAKPPPPPVAPTPKKSAVKKGRGGAPTTGATIATPAFNAVNDNAASAQLQAETAKSSSPSKKRKSAATDTAAEPEGTKKKRSRKSKADEVAAAPEPAPPASSPPAETSGKKKKDKKKKKSGD